MNPTQPRAQAQQCHTPGPWTYRPELGGVYFFSEGQPQDGKPRGQIHDISDGQTWNGGMLPVDEREATGRLIAAAPELLAALRRVTRQLANLADTVRNTVPIDGAVHAAIAASRAAIAKATEGAK